MTSLRPRGRASELASNVPGFKSHQVPVFFIFLHLSSRHPQIENATKIFSSRYQMCVLLNGHDTKYFQISLSRLKETLVKKKI